MLCDGRVVCGCADPYGHRVLGDARAVSLRQIWTGPVIATLRAELNAGGSTFCGDCALKLPLKKDDPGMLRSVDAGALPSRLYVECTAACNISCTEACCAPETGITRTRQAGMLDFDLFRRVVDEAGPSLVRIDFFNYGEAFLHKRAVEMCEYIKSRFPHIYLYTSTNGLALSEAAGAAPRALGDRRGDVLDRRRYARVVRQVPPAWPLRPRDRDADRHGRREAPRRAGSALPELALHPVRLERQRRGDESRPRAGGRHRSRSPVLGNDRPPGTRLLSTVRARVPAVPVDPARSLGRQRPRQRDPRRDASRANRRPDACTGRAGHARRAVGCTFARASTTCRLAPSRHRRPTGAAWSVSARSSATPPARSSIAISRGRGYRERSPEEARSTCRSTFPPPGSRGIIG